MQKSAEMMDPKEKRSVKRAHIGRGDIRCVENRELSLSASEPATQKEVRNCSILFLPRSDGPAGGTKTTCCDVLLFFLRWF